jgi:hypothetical protein
MVVDVPSDGVAVYVDDIGVVDERIVPPVTADVAVTPIAAAVVDAAVVADLRAPISGDEREA